MNVYDNILVNSDYVDKNVCLNLLGLIQCVFNSLLEVELGCIRHNYFLGSLGLNKLIFIYF